MTRIAIPLLFGSALGVGVTGLFSRVDKFQSAWLLVCVLFAIFTWFREIIKGKV